MSKNKAQAKTQGQGAEAKAANANAAQSIITAIPSEKLGTIEIATAVSLGIVPRKAGSLMAMIRTKMLKPSVIPQVAKQLTDADFPVYVFRLYQSYSETPKYLVITSTGKVIPVNVPINHPRVQAILRAIVEYQ